MVKLFKTTKGVIQINGFTTAESLEDALKQLYLVDAIDENGTITSLGRTMAGT